MASTHRHFSARPGQVALKSISVRSDVTEVLSALSVCNAVESDDYSDSDIGSVYYFSKVFHLGPRV